jgi:hypothetical protein
LKSELISLNIGRDKAILAAISFAKFGGSVLSLVGLGSEFKYLSLFGPIH